MSYRGDDAAALRRRDELAHRLTEALPDAERIDVETQIAAIDRERIEAARIRLPLVARARIASPCTERWDTMIGDGAVRACSRCEKDVFDLSLMTLGQAEALIASRVGKETCARIYKRRDGTMMFADCDVGARGVVLRQVGAMTAGLVIGGAALAWANAAPPPPRPSVAPRAPSAAARAAADAFLHAAAAPAEAFVLPPVTPHEYEWDCLSGGCAFGPWSPIMGDVISEVPSHLRNHGAERRRGTPTIHRVRRVDGDGTFDSALVLRAVRSRRSVIHACYERALTEDADLRGAITVALTIEETGAVRDVRATSDTLESDEVALCVVRVLSGIRFSTGPSGGSVTFEVPLDFTPRAPTERPRG